MRTVVLVPRRGGGWRDEAWAAIYPEIEKLGYEVFTADSDTEVFAITHAWNKAAELAGDWDQAILHLADQCIVTPESVHEAVNSDHPGIRWCFDKAIRLNEAGTKAFIEGKRGTKWDRKELRKKQLPYPMIEPHIWYEGPRVVTRELWDKVGGFTERMVGWGAEDQLFSHLAERHYPSIRAKGVMVDLWHPKYNAEDPYYQNHADNIRIYKEELGL